jgi:hypothetical protein
VAVFADRDSADAEPDRLKTEVVGLGVGEGGR